MKNSQITLRLVITFALYFGTALPVEAKRVALVIGIDAYENVKKLKKAVNDARVMGGTLNDLNFTVLVSHNPSRRVMNRKLAEFTQQIDKGDEALFFFAGHGIDVEGGNFLLPADIPSGRAGEDFVKSEAISVTRILQMIQKRGARVSILVLDACRNNPFRQVAGRSIGSSRGLGRIAAPEGTFIMYSAGEGQVALDGLSESDPNPNSVFTRTLVPMLKQPGLKITDMARSLRRKVQKLAKRIAHKQRPAYYDEVTGDFYFKQGKRGALDAKKNVKINSDNSVNSLELAFWNSVKNTSKTTELQSYVKAYPNGAFTSLAKIRLAALKPQKSIRPKKLKSKKLVVRPDNAIVEPKTKGSLGLKLCNKTSSRIGVVIGYKVKNKKGWVTEGWWNVGANSCTDILKKKLSARYYYIHAEDYVRDGEWSGKAKMCVKNKSFTITGAEKKCTKRGSRKAGFFEIDTKNENSWTVNLTPVNKS